MNKPSAQTAQSAHGDSDATADPCTAQAMPDAPSDSPPTKDEPSDGADDYVPL